jgi:hypothetical protein
MNVLFTRTVILCSSWNEAILYCHRHGLSLQTWMTLTWMCLGGIAHELFHLFFTDQVIQAEFINIFIVDCFVTFTVLFYNALEIKVFRSKVAEAICNEMQVQTPRTSDNDNSMRIRPFSELFGTARLTYIARKDNG